MDAQHNMLELIVRWIWVPILMFLARLWTRVNGQETRTSLLEQSNRHYERQREADLKHQEELRGAILDKVGEHHTAVMKRIDRFENNVKNGK